MKIAVLSIQHNLKVFSELRETKTKNVVCYILSQFQGEEDAHQRQRSSPIFTTNFPTANYSC